MDSIYICLRGGGHACVLVCVLVLKHNCVSEGVAVFASTKFRLREENTARISTRHAGDRNSVRFLRLNGVGVA